MRLVFLSDTHGRHGDVVVPEGDVLVHAGDFSRRGRPREIEAFGAWLATLPHPHKVVIAGNHDFLFEEDDAARYLLGEVTYLQDTGCTILGVRFWGSPWQPRFFDWAFNLDRGADLAEKWALIPPGTDVLVTHGPPRGVLDRTVHGELVGCDDLLAAVQRLRPRVHAFGHIHEAYGRLDKDGTCFINASACTVRMDPVQAPVVVDL